MLLTPIDYILASVYIIFVIFVGLKVVKRNREENFLISNRELGSFSSAMTIGATKIGAGALITFSTLVFAFGYGALWLLAGYLFGYVVFYIFAWTLIKESHQKKYYTLADYFQSHFGKNGKNVALVIGIMCVIALSGWIVTNFVAGGKIISYITGFPFWLSLIIVAAIITPYLVAGGFNSTVRTDIIQYSALLIILGFLTYSFFSGNYSDVVTSYNNSLKLGEIISFFIIGLFFPLGSADLWQRAYATKNRKAFSSAIIIASLSFLFLGIMLANVCLHLRSFVLSQSLDPELGLVFGISKTLGVGFSGLWIIAFTSAVASSADTFVYTSSASLIQDVYGRVKKFTSMQCIKNIRFSILLFSIFGIISSLILRNVINVTFFFAGITMSLGAIAIISRLFKSLPLWSMLISGPFGFVCALTQILVFKISVFTAASALGGTFLILFFGLISFYFSKIKHILD